LSLISQGTNPKQLSYNSEKDLPEIPVTNIESLLSKLKYNYKKVLRVTYDLA